MSKLAKDYAEDFVGYWEDYFIKHVIKDPSFTTRMVFSPKEWKDNELGITFFKNELPTEGNPIYLELLVNNEGNTGFIPYQDKEGVRKLYKLEYRELSEYSSFDRISKESNKPYQVVGVRLGQLTLCSERMTKHNVSESISEETLKEMEISYLEDDLFSSMSIREFYCILHRIPMTRRKWLNDLITREDGRK